jgi:hypothetical protein
MKAFEVRSQPHLLFLRVSEILPLVINGGNDMCSFLLFLIIV